MTDKEATQEQKTFELTEFYCEEHKEWHRKGDVKFLKCLNHFQAYHSFKVSKLSGR